MKTAVKIEKKNLKKEMLNCTVLIEQNKNNSKI